MVCLKGVYEFYSFIRYLEEDSFFFNTMYLVNCKNLLWKYARARIRTYEVCMHAKK